MDDRRAERNRLVHELLSKQVHKRKKSKPSGRPVDADKPLPEPEKPKAKPAEEKK